MGKTLLIVSGGIEAASRQARQKSGLTVVSDRDPTAPSFCVCRFLPHCRRLQRRRDRRCGRTLQPQIRKIDGVICVAQTRHGNGNRSLPGNSVFREFPVKEQPNTDKLAMKRRFAERGVRVPWFPEVQTLQSLQRIAIERGNNLVIKPVDSRGSRGVQRVAQVKNLTKAFILARSLSPTQRVMVEEYLDGPQVSTESVVIGGVCHTPGFSDRNYEYLDTYAPFFIENGGDLPSHLPEDIRRS